MSILPFAALWTVLAVAGIVSGALKSQPRLRFPLIVVSILVASGLWFWAGSPTPEALPSASFLGYSLTITPGAWQLTGLTLLLLLTATTSGWFKTAPDDNPHYVLVPALGLLPFIWAGDPLTAVLMLGLFAVAWTFVLWRAGGFEGADSSLPGHLAMFLFAPVLLIWFADAIALSRLDDPIWVELAGAAVLLTGALLLGAWPLARWRQAALRGTATTSVALVGLPPIAGASVLLPVAQQSSASGLVIALAIILGLSALLLGLRWAWQPMDRGATSALGLAGALAGLVLLTAVFASESAMLAATRVAVFAPLILMLIALPHTAELVGASRPTHVLWEWVSVGSMIVAWLAAIGLPLTAGFVSITGLVGSWQSGPYYLLIVILVILLTLWSAALFQHMMRLARQTRQRGTSAMNGAGLPGAVPLLLPIVALIAIDGSILSGATVIGWLAVLIPLVAGPAIAWLLDSRFDVAETVVEPLLPQDRLAPVVARIGQWRVAAGDAVAEAVGIVEGPSGLLWIVIIIALLVLVSR